MGRVVSGSRDHITGPLFTLITNLSLNSSSGLSFMFKLRLSIFYTKINGVTFAINQ